MTNLLLRDLRARGVVLEGVVPFVRPELIERMSTRHPDCLVVQVPADVRPGPYWLVSRADAHRMIAAGSGEYRSYPVHALKMQIEELAKSHDD
jgi:hypothetical protein